MYVKMAERKTSNKNNLDDYYIFQMPHISLLLFSSCIFYFQLYIQQIQINYKIIINYNIMYNFRFNTNILRKYIF